MSQRRFIEEYLLGREFDPVESQLFDLLTKQPLPLVSTDCVVRSDLYDRGDRRLEWTFDEFKIAYVMSVLARPRSSVMVLFSSPAARINAVDKIMDFVSKKNILGLDGRTTVTTSKCVFENDSVLRAHIVDEKRHIGNVVRGLKFHSIVTFFESHMDNMSPLTFTSTDIYDMMPSLVWGSKMLCDLSVDGNGFLKMDHISCVHPIVDATTSSSSTPT